jgi:ubiquinone/menaquinone biosynthesis C-methylase UbiE
MTSKPGNNKADQEYFTGNDSDFTLKYHSSRTADTHAGWFLPYLQPGMTLLDCGCGSGSITVGLANAVEPGQVTGVDISEIEIKRARKRAAETKIANIGFEVGNIHRLDYSDDSFDALFSHNVLEHISEPSSVLREMRRILKPSGIIGIRDIDMGGILIVPDEGLLEQFLAIHEADWNNIGGLPRIGRLLGELLSEVGFVEVEISVSYDFYGDLEGRRFIAQVLVSRLAEADFVERVTGCGLAKVEELEVMKDAWLTWRELPGALFAISHCEAIGRK